MLQRNLRDRQRGNFAGPKTVLKGNRPLIDQEVRISPHECCVIRTIEPENRTQELPEVGTLSPKTGPNNEVRKSDFAFIHAGFGRFEGNVNKYVIEPENRTTSRS